MEENVRNNKVEAKKEARDASNGMPIFEKSDLISKKKHNNRKAYCVEMVAKMHGVDESYVYKIVRADRLNEQILASYIHLMEAENELLASVRALIPFDL